LGKIKEIIGCWHVLVAVFLKGEKGFCFYSQKKVDLSYFKHLRLCANATAWLMQQGMRKERNGNEERRRRVLMSKYKRPNL
jgi:hypothetical protein